jgi:S-formylglutathione hydrolase FrmB
VLLLAALQTEANPLRNRPVLRRTSRKLAGEILDFTHNHGSDNRIWSPALCTKRDLYVYLPPCFDPNRRYPLVLWLHGFGQDEVSFLQDVIPHLDQAIACGKLPPMIIAAPDGTLHGWACNFTNVASFFINTKAGRFEDYLMQDVWCFLQDNFPILPERQAHIIAGVSMGGGSAYNTAFKYRDRFGIVIGVFPPLNTRWENCRGRYRANFDPDCWNYRENFNKWCEPVARFYGVFTIRLGAIIRPLYGRAPDTAEQIARENPIELLVNQNIQDGEFSMLVAWGKKDQFNIDAQVESFLYVANCRGVHLTTLYDPRGRHDRRTALKFMPTILDWLEPQLAIYRR